MRYLKLKDYINALRDLNILDDCCVSFDEAQIKCVTYDSQKVQPDSLFICKGANFKSEYLHQAFAKGAVAYIAKEQIDGVKNCILVNDIRAAIVASAQLFFDNAPQKLKTIGITGTKGKGCVAYFTEAILHEYLDSQNKPKPALVSSIRTYDGIQDFESHLTTPETLELHENFYNAYQSNIDYLIMEVSSLAIKFGRTQDINYDVACFTNFGKDHISKIEHPNMQDYFESKLKIFDTAKNACVNLDCKRSQEVFEYANKRCNVITFGENEKAMVRATNIESSNGKISFDAITPSYKLHINLNVSGLFNVSNALAAIAIAHLLQIPSAYIVNGLEKANVPGRMQYFSSNDKKLTIIVDYAHNKLSFEALFSSLIKEYPDHKITAAFGSIGNKSFDRRIDLPAVASKYCSKIIICNEDPESEGFESIASDMAANITISDYKLIEDRQLAVETIIKEHNFNQPLLIAFLGKGDEEYMKIGHTSVPHISDVAIAKNCIQEYNSNHKL